MLKGSMGMRMVMVDEDGDEQSKLAKAGRLGLEVRNSTTSGRKPLTVINWQDSFHQ
jgi:hypothetical protein